eukprot:scaffold115565_cov22-Tisochrysis_lutea.AAC.1
MSHTLQSSQTFLFTVLHFPAAPDLIVPLGARSHATLLICANACKDLSTVKPPTLPILSCMQVVNKAMGNDLYDKSDHKWLMADVLLE